MHRLRPARGLTLFLPVALWISSCANRLHGALPTTRKYLLIRVCGKPSERVSGVHQQGPQVSPRWCQLGLFGGVLKRLAAEATREQVALRVYPRTCQLQPSYLSTRDSMRLQGF